LHFKLWHYHERIFPVVEDISVPVNLVVVPIIAMFWVRYCPIRFKEKMLWALGWTTVLVVVELPLERFTDLLTYHNGYDWYFSYILWFFSWFIWHGFHLWLNDWHREIDSLFLKAAISLRHISPTLLMP
jgi:hypothetical protein